MMRANIVYVVGAGASKEAKLPTGHELKKNIANLLDIKHDFDKQVKGDPLILDAVREYIKRGDVLEKDINKYIYEAVAIKDALRGEVIQEELMVLNTNKEESDYDLIAEGDIAKWVKFYLPEDLESPITQVQIPAKAYFKIVTQFFVPEDAPNKEYSGKLTVTSVPSEKEESSAQISVKQQLSREVSIVVTDREIVNLNASIIPHRYGLETNETLNIRVIYDNQGNVSLNPQIQVKIKKDGEVVSNAIYPYPDEEPSVKPGSRYEIPQLEIQTGNL